MTTRTEIINYLIKENDFKNYLEIGVGNGYNFNHVICQNKESVDPYENTNDGCCKEVVTYNMTSDEMFENMDPDKKYDLIFIDGLHKGEQVLKDISNSLKHLKSNGYILIHDSLPLTKERGCFPRGNQMHWNGSVYKAYPVLVENNVSFQIIDTDEGIGVIRGSEIEKNITTEESEMEWEEVFKSDYDYKNKFNIITIEDFIKEMES